jgi:hypothetical protein
MVMEQRIGRIDRIGQQAKRLVIRQVDEKPAIRTEPENGE